MVDESRPTSEVRIRISARMLEAVDIAVKIGAGNNRSDFIRSAIVEKLIQLNIYDEMKKLVLK